MLVVKSKNVSSHTEKPYAVVTSINLCPDAPVMVTSCAFLPLETVNSVIAILSEVSIFAVNAASTYFPLLV